MKKFRKGVSGRTWKLKTIQGNPKPSLLLENDNSRQDIKGPMMVQGTAPVHSNPAETLHKARETARLRGSTGRGPAVGVERECHLHQGGAGAIQVVGLFSRLVILGNYAKFPEAQRPVATASTSIWMSPAKRTGTTPLRQPCHDSASWMLW